MKHSFVKHSLFLLFSVFYVNPSASHITIQRGPNDPVETVVIVFGGFALPKHKKKKDSFGFVDITREERADMGIVDRVKLRRAQRVDITEALIDYREESKCQKEQLEV